MHSLKTDTRNWMIAIYYYMTGRKGISAMQLSKELGVRMGGKRMPYRELVS